MRYDARRIISNDNPLYREKLRRIGKGAITQYATAPMRSPTEAEIDTLDIRTHTWRLGDRFYKLADEFYGDPRLWWIIAQYNMMPTEAYVALGFQVYIPLPLERILLYYGL